MYPRNSENIVEDKYQKIKIKNEQKQAKPKQNPTLRHVIFKLQKIKDKEKNLKRSQRKTTYL